jgi:SecD/SecF fusion protein
MNDTPVDYDYTYIYVSLGIALLILALSVLLSWFLSKKLWRMPDYTGKFLLVLLPLIAGAAICLLRRDDIRLGIDLRGGVILVYDVVGGAQQSAGSAIAEPDAGGDDAVSKEGMDKLIAAIKKRVDPSGTKETTVRQFGPRQVEIIVPSDPKKEVDQAEVARLMRILSQAGNLEFRILATPKRHDSIIERARQMGPTEIRLLGSDGKILAWWVPILPRERSKFEGDKTIAVRTRTVQGEEHLEALVVKDEYNVDGGYLARSSRGADEKGQLAVDFQFDSTGGNKFGGLTGSHNPDPTYNNEEYRLGIILDNVLYSAPGIRTTIFQNGQITGGFDQQQVDDLVAVLTAGALPATLSKEPISQRLIGPTLGRDTIEKGLLSLKISVALVFISVLLYYGFAGVVACLALAMNGILLLALMILLRAPFTLPGLAGFALTIGMAVDANVLIFERMREEAARGAALRMTIRNGFERAWNAIFDSNLTTLITAAVLWWIGTDQVKGFAVTLFLGICLSMFTAIFCARVVFDVAERRKWISAVRMRQAIGETRFNFLSRKKMMIGISITVIVIGLVASGLRGRGLFDIDFTGGISVEAVFEKPQEIAEIRDRLEKLNLQDVVVSEVQLRGEEPGHRFVINTSNPADVTAEQYLQQVKQILKDMEGEGPQYRLSRNALTPGKITPATLPAPSGKPAAAAPEKAASPKPGEQSRLGGWPGGRAEWMALSTLLLGAADAAREPPKDGPKKEEPPKPAAQAAPPAKETPKEPVKEAPKEPAKEAPKEPAKEPTKEAPKEAPKEPAKEPPKEPAKEPPKETPKGVVKTEPGKPVEKPAPSGSQTTLKFDHPINHNALLDILRDQVADALAMGRESVQITLTNDKYEDGSMTPYESWDVKLELPAQQAEVLLKAVQKYFQDNPYFPSSDTIGGAVAKNTRYRAVMALLASAVFILLYLWIRFQRVTYGLGAIASLVHDVLVTLAFVAVSSWLARIPGVTDFLGIDPFKINLVMMSAFLTIAGYSLNDTIVIFDRIREVRGKAPDVTEAMINLSINQTLGRTLLTGLTSMMVIVILYILGGPTIHGFAYAMIIGVVTGTYSSIYIASPFLLWVSQKAERKK